MVRAKKAIFSRATVTGGRFAMVLGLMVGAFSAVPAQAHFLELIPEHPVIDQASGADQTLTLRFHICD